MSTSAYIEQRQAHFNQIVKQFLPRIDEIPVDLHQAMDYAVASGGKRMRPLLVYATGEMLGAHLERLDAAACCMEFIHAYSLIHDDLPAMDNSDYRRGKPACHKVFGEAVAILAGNALQNLAFELIAKQDDLSAELRLEMIKSVSYALGCEGVLGGQALDLKSQNETLSMDQIEVIHRMKTAALIACSVKMGALAAGCEDLEKLKKLEQLATDFGLAFQIGDDIADSDETTLNLANRFGLKAAQQRMEGLYQSIFERLNIFAGLEKNPLYWVMHYIKAIL